MLWSIGFPAFVAPCSASFRRLDCERPSNPRVCSCALVEAVGLHHNKSFNRNPHRRLVAPDRSGYDRCQEADPLRVRLTQGVRPRKMLSRFRRWIDGIRSRRAAHSRAWVAAIEPQADGLSAFQHMATAALIESIPDIDLTRAGQSEPYFTGQIPGSKARVFIYHSQAEISGGPELFGEFQDYDCPADLVREFVAVARRAHAV